MQKRYQDHIGTAEFIWHFPYETLVGLWNSWDRPTPFVTLPPVPFSLSMYIQFSLPSLSQTHILLYRHTNVYKNTTNFTLAHQILIINYSLGPDSQKSKEKCRFLLCQKKKKKKTHTLLKRNTFSKWPVLCMQIILYRQWLLLLQRCGVAVSHWEVSVNHTSESWHKDLLSLIIQP